MFTLNAYDRCICFDDHDGDSSSVIQPSSILNGPTGPSTTVPIVTVDIYVLNKVLNYNASKTVIYKKLHMTR